MRDFPRETLLRLALHGFEGGGPRRLAQALASCGSVDAARRVSGALPADMRARLAQLCADDAGLRAHLARDIELLEREDLCVLSVDDDGYPPLLAETDAAPPLLFVAGDAGVLACPQVAIVGSRHASPAGLATARAFAADLAQAGFVITSGLALGVDAAAHEGALAAGGMTIAVLGCGLDSVYPRRHATLASRIRRAGCLASEFSAGTGPLAQHFPQRNRIISGLSLAVIVVEAAPDSGSLITARFAAEQGRDVFAVPGSIHSPLSRGCHQLIREGATLVESSAQVMEALAHHVMPMHRRAGQPVVADLFAAGDGLDPEELCLLRAMDAAGSGVDQLVGVTGLDAARVCVLLTALELRGLVAVATPGLWQPAGTVPCGG